MGNGDHSKMRIIRSLAFLSVIFIGFSNALDEDFSEVVKVGRKKVTCDFSFSFTADAVTKSSASCSPKKVKSKSTTVTLTAPSGFVFEVKLRINQPTTKILSAKIVEIPEKETTQVTTTAASEEEGTPTRNGKQVSTPPENLSGEWKTIQRRSWTGNTENYFEKSMQEYKTGFGNNNELWLGLDKMAELTAEGTWEMAIEVKDWTGKIMTASYSNFKVGSSPRYELTALGYDYSSSLRDALKYHNGAAFSTVDEDQDDYTGNCAQKYGGGGWWFRKCYHANLNGRIEDEGKGGASAARWFRQKVQEASMKIRKVSN